MSSFRPIVSRIAVWLVAALVAAVAGGVREAAALGVGDVRGHLSLGFAHLVIDDAPGGSLSTAAGVDVPAGAGFRVGIGAGYHLLGSRTVERGSLLANLDYSLFEASAQATWVPPGGPIGRVSLGPALMAPHAELSTSGGGAAFSDLALSKVTGGLALDVTAISRSTSPVRVGLELGARVAFLTDENWTVLTSRVAFHY